MLRGPEAEDALEVLLRYLAATHPTLGAEKIRALLDSAVGPQGQEVIVSFLEEIKDEGKREGRKEGREEGRRAISRTLEQLLTHRFGPLPEEVEQRVRQADEAALHRWTLRVLGAASLDDVLREEPSTPRRNGSASRRPRAARPPRRA